MAKLFVYGTLKRGYSRATVLQGEEFLGTAKTAACYRLYNCGNYPGLVENTNGVSIEGELWEVSPDCLKRLDEIEGVAVGLYQRAEVSLMAPYHSEKAYTYLYLKSLAGLKDCSPRWG